MNQRQYELITVSESIVQIIKSRSSIVIIGLEGEHTIAQKRQKIGIK